MENEKGPRSSRSRVLKTLFWIFVFYAVGIFVRHGYGTRWEISNKSGTPLHDISLGFAGWKYAQEVPIRDLAPGQVKRFFFRPCMKSSFSFNFTDAQGERHTEQSETYIPANDTSTITVTIDPSNKVEMSLPTGSLVSWESWFGLLYTDRFP